MSDQDLVWLLLAWSTLAVVLAWALPARWQPGAIATCGVGFLASVSPVSLLLLATSTLATWLLRHKVAGRPAVVMAGVVGIVAMCVPFMMSGDPTADGIGSRVILPAGMAFYSLRLIHYLVESYKGELRAHSLIEYCCYHFLPSALPVGPVHRFDDFLRDLRRRRWDSQRFSEGLERVLYGLAKLVLVVNYLLGKKVAVALAGPMAPPGFEGTYLTAGLFWVELYVLFSGYSDLAIGFAGLLGFRLRENFNWPVLARNISDFWRRWHMSLASWCRDYVFTPALSVTRSHVIAVLAAMVVLGLWHELSLRYLLWGGYHGLGIAGHRLFAERVGPAIARLPVGLQRTWRVLATALTLHFVLFSFEVTTAIEHIFRGL